VREILGGLSWRGGKLTCSNRPLLKSFFSPTAKPTGEKRASGPQDAIYMGKLPPTSAPPPENPTESEGHPRGSAGEPIEKCLFVAASGAGAAAVAAVVLLAKSRGPRTPSDDKSLLTDYSTVGTYCRHSLAPSGTATRPTNQPAASNKSTSVSSK